MQLTPRQSDALGEFINIGFGRAAASLSRLTGHRVQLEAPHVSLCDIAALAAELRPFVEGDLASVHQVFGGPVSGDALLVLDERSAGLLKELLTNEPALPLAIDASAREVIVEVGNIVLNACLGMFGNLLQVQVSFSVPHVTLEALETVLGSLTVEREGIRYALVVRSAFRLRHGSVTGHIIIVLGVGSITRLIGAVERWEQGQR